MNGIEILNTVTQTPDKAGGMMIMYIMFAGILLAFAGLSAWSAKEMIEDVYMDWKDWVGVSVLILIFAACCVGDYFLIRATVDESHRQETIVYATIDDTVPWTVINEKYELIRQDGKIYQLRVREDGDE